MRTRLCWVRLGRPQWQAGYRRDFDAQHWWLDLYWWRFCAIRRRREIA